MNVKHRLLALLMLATMLTLFGCGDPTVDASSDESMKASIDRVKERLTEDQVEEFEDALKALMFSGVDSLADLADADGLERRFKDRIGGLTAAEIIDEAQRITERRDTAQRAELLEKANALQDQMDTADQARADLSRFVVEQSRFYRESSAFMSSAVIELTVVNNTDHPIARVHCDAVLATPGRAIPWVEASLTYRIPGGLEPGERDTWKLSPNMFGEWGSAPQDRDDMVLTIDITRLDGADDQPLFGADFDRSDEEELRRIVGQLDSSDRPQFEQNLAARDAQLKAELERKQQIQYERDRRESARRAEEQKRQVESEVQELISRQAAAQGAAAMRSRFVVERSRFYFQDTGFMTEPVIELSVRNGTESTIARVYFDAILDSPERDTAWLEDRFNYQIRGGLQPGETATWKLSPNMFGDWGKVPKDRDDMVLTVSANRLDGPDEERLFPEDFSVEDEVRLQTLQAVLAGEGAP